MRDRVRGVCAINTDSAGIETVVGSTDQRLYINGDPIDLHEISNIERSIAIVKHTLAQPGITVGLQALSETAAVRPLIIARDVKKLNDLVDNKTNKCVRPWSIHVDETVPLSKATVTGVSFKGECPEETEHKSFSNSVNQAVDQVWRNKKNGVFKTTDLGLSNRASEHAFESVVTRMIYRGEVRRIGRGVFQVLGDGIADTEFDSVVTEASLRFNEGIEPSINWKSRGECVGVDYNVMHPRRGEPVDDAKRVCLGCHVRVDCLLASLKALKKIREIGISGGLSGRQKRDVIKRAKQGARG